MNPKSTPDHPAPLTPFKRPLLRRPAFWVCGVCAAGLFLLLLLQSERQRREESTQLFVLYNPLSVLQGAVDAWALESRATVGDPVTITGDDLVKKNYYSEYHRHVKRYRDVATLHLPGLLGEYAYAVTKRRLLHYPPGTKIFSGIFLQPPGSDPETYERFHLNDYHPGPLRLVPFLWMAVDISTTKPTLVRIKPATERSPR